MTSQAEQLRNAWVDYLLRYDWSHTFDITSEYPLSPSRLKAQFHQTLRYLTQAAQGPVRAFLALEKTTSGQYHGHALIAGTEMLPVDRVQRAWRDGFSRVRRVSRAKDAAGYATKWAAVNSEDYELYGRWDRSPRARARSSNRPA